MPMGPMQDMVAAFLRQNGRNIAKILGLLGGLWITATILAVLAALAIYHAF